MSVNGGIAARWAVDGEELYYIAPDGTIMVVDVPARGSGSDFGAPRRLFQPNIVGGGSAVVGLRQQYDVDARGRFLVNTNVNAAVAQTPPITLLLNADAFRRTP